MLKVIYHEDYYTNYFTSLAEHPLRIKSIHNKLKDLYEIVTPVHAAEEDILRVHTREHLEKVRQEGVETYQTALLAAGGALYAGQLAYEGSPAFAAVRPPGHHAGRSRYSGFCFFNNVAISVAALRQTGRIESAVIIDTDMHQGDGTQNIFAEEPAVSIIDIHARDRKTYLNLLLDRIDRIPPVDLIAVSAGFDLYARDWGGLLETSDFRRIGHAVHRAAAERAKGRYFAVLEGGYYVNELGRNVLAFCEGMEGRATDPATDFYQMK